MLIHHNTSLFEKAHSSVEKAAMLNGVKLRKLRSQRGGQYDNFHVAAETLDAAIKVTVWFLFQEINKNNFVFFRFKTIILNNGCSIYSKSVV